MMRLIILLFAICAIGCSHATPEATTSTTDPELQQLLAALDAANTQLAMNIASKKISDYWDAKLASVEKRIACELGDKMQKRFAQSIERWRSYREQEVAFHADFFAGGSIRPLIANGCYSQMTEHRIAELEALFADALGK